MQLFFSFRKNYPTIRQENKTFIEKLDELNQSIQEKNQEKTVILSNLRRAVALVTESLKVEQEDKEKTTSVPTVNLFTELYDILTSTNEVDVDEQQKVTDLETNLPVLNVR